MRLPITFVLLGLFLPVLPATAVTSVGVQIEPAEPVYRETFTVKIEGVAPVVPEVASTSVGAGVIRIDLAFAPCGGCVDAPFEIEVPFAPTFSSDDPEPGETTVEVRDADGALLGARDLRILEVARGTLVESVKVTPWPATDNDIHRVDLIYNSSNCHFAEISVDPLVWQGNTAILEFYYRRNFLVSEGVAGAGKCSPAIDFVDVLDVEIGQLEAGSYRLLVYLNFEGLGLQTRELVALRTIQVEDAPDVLKLQGGRFEASVAWKLPDGRQGPGRPVPGASSDTGLFSFFERENWELMVKVLDACAANGHFWVIGSASTDVEFDLQIVDTENGAVYTHRNPQGALARAFGSATAFSGCPE